MTDRERFCKIQAKRGYEVTNMGLMSVMVYEDDELVDTQVWMWNPDGSKDIDNKMSQQILWKKYPR